MMTIHATADMVAPSLDPSMLPRTIYHQHLRKVSTMNTDEKTVHLNFYSNFLSAIFPIIVLHDHPHHSGYLGPWPESDNATLNAPL